MTNLNASVVEAIKVLAKQKKISANACLEAATLALSMQPASAPRATRQAGEQSVAFRNAVVENLPTLKGRQVTFAQIAKEFNIDAPNCANNIKWLKEHNKIDYKIIGKGVKEPGVRGRAPVVIEFV